MIQFTKVIIFELCNVVSLQKAQTKNAFAKLGLFVVKLLKISLIPVSHVTSFNIYGRFLKKSGI